MGSHDAISVLVNARAIEHEIGLRICDALRSKGIKYSVRDNLPITSEAKAVFWQRVAAEPLSTHSSEAMAVVLSSEGNASADALGDYIPCVAVMLDGSEFLDLLAKGNSGNGGLLSFFSSLAKLCLDRFKIHVAVMGLDTEIRLRERKDRLFSPSKCEEELANLAVTCQGLQIHKVRDASEAGEYIAGLSKCLAGMMIDGASAGEGHAHPSSSVYAKKAKIFPSSLVTVSDRRLSGGAAGLVWLNMIHQIPQVGAKVAEAVASAVGGFRQIMEQYTSTPTGATSSEALTLQQKKDLVRHHRLTGGSGSHNQTSGRSIGPAISSKLFEYFTAESGDDTI